VGAGLTLESEEDAQLDEAARTAKRKARLREIKRIITKALEALQESGFLKSFEVTRRRPRPGGSGASVIESLLTFDPRTIDL